MRRRRLLHAGCAACAALGSRWASAQSPGWTMPPRFTKPDLATDEGGLWALMDREEARLRRSPFRVRDEALEKYLADIACRLGGAHCPDIRVYVVRTPYFNASMAPNGMMQIWTGLLLRMDNEAQLAAVMAHEVGHFLQRHSVERLRDIKARSAFGQFIGLFGVVGLVGQLATLAAAMAYSRDQEREADRVGLELMRDAGYDPREAPKVWGNLLDELRATPDNDPAKNSVLFASHPPSDERRGTLETMSAGGSGQTGEAGYEARVEALRFQMLEDELRRGRFAESIVLLDRLLAGRADHPDLLYFRGEVRRIRNADGDGALAVADLEAALRTTREPAPAHRALGYLYRAGGRPQDARAAFERYLQRAPAAADAALIQQHISELSS